MKIMKKFLAVSALSAGILLSPFHAHDAQAKVWWNGMELVQGQIGKLTVLKDTELYKLQGEKKVYIKTLKAGGVYRIYTFKPGMLGLGGRYYVDRDARVKYETPSKAKLNQVKMEQLFRGVKLGMSASQVKKLETAKLILQENIDGGQAWVYSTSLFGYHTLLVYGFENGKLAFYGYSFDAGKEYTNDQLTAIYNNLKQQLITLFGNQYEQSDSGQGYPPALVFHKDGLVIALSYDADGLAVTVTSEQ
ncbi:hypothetical protein [Geobacillus zalihae]|uniref:hypothetical protein n=1 Tax=Geobacillus zalihae TaxID=213419 RepID=UPI001681BD32|nr:hypothetical protein [Geobacillus zalihae]QNU23366.1 hypothetical protein IC806_09175 [Geobacillus zalihae]